MPSASNLVTKRPASSETDTQSLAASAASNSKKPRAASPPKDSAISRLAQGSIEKHPSSSTLGSKAFRAGPAEASAPAEASGLRWSFSKEVLKTSIFMWCRDMKAKHPENANDYDEASKRIIQFLEHPNRNQRYFEFPFDLPTINPRDVPEEDWVIDHTAVYMDFSGLKIKSLPDVFQSPLIARRLQALNLSETLIEALPEHFNLPHLRVLHLENSSFRSFPLLFSPPKLQKLVAQNTDMERLPTNFNPPILYICDLRGTKLDSLPEHFNPPVLHFCDLRETNLNSLPESFEHQKVAHLLTENTPFGVIPLPGF